MNQEYNDHHDDEAIEIEAIGIEVTSHPIELYKLFKVANLVGGGGEAKHFIAEGYVAVNGELETRKRRKMYAGDFFEFDQEYYVVVCDQPPVELEEKKKKTSTKLDEHAMPASKANKQKKQSKKSKQQPANKTKKTTEQTKARKTTKDPNSGRGGIDFF